MLWQTDRVRSFLIQTEEPCIPWELCRMTITRDGRTEARGYLCELFEMSRWLPGVSAEDIAQRDAGRNRRAARQWACESRDRGGDAPRPGGYRPSVSRVKATYEATITALGSHQYDVVHFIGHGRNVSPANATRSEFRLAGRWRLTPSDISGETRNLGMSSPIIFMNACQVAQGSMALNGVGGWAAALTRAGAGAFVGTHWDVRDDLAQGFAREFYEQLVNGQTVAAAVQAARRALLLRDDGDATWLSYSVHASPGARCRFAPPAE